MDKFKETYLEIILEENNMISERSLLKNIAAATAITGGSLFGLGELARIENEQKPKAKIEQSTSQNTKDISSTNFKNLSEIDSVDETEKIEKSEKQKEQKEQKQAAKPLTSEEYFVARVLYSETSSIASTEEIKMIAQIIINRIDKKDFGKCSTAYEVVHEKGQFSCINDKNNTNWNEFKPNLNNRAKLCSTIARVLMSPNVKSTTFFNDDSIVYYHDKSISSDVQIKKWTNKYYKPVLKYSTTHFNFYSVEQNK